ncbi:MAG TPA: hypothetical protein VF070_09640 [Streptosporangiaceae bacterium]
MDTLATAGSVLESDLGLVPSGVGSICYRAADDRGFRDVENSARDLLTRHSVNPKAVEIRRDSHGFRWLTVSRPQAQYPSLVTDLRAASKAFADNDYGMQMLCAMTVFEGLADVQAALVYLYKRETLYPFAPKAGNIRDNRLELDIREALKGHAPVESDVTRWFPVWDAPGMKY